MTFGGDTLESFDFSNGTSTKVRAGGVADFKGGKDAAKMSILGAVMKANKGAPNEVVRRLLDEELKRV